jgi:hypothetical protein
VVKVRTATVVANAKPLSAAVGDVQSPPAVPTPQQASQQGVTPTDGAADHQPFGLGIVGDQALVPLKLGPRDVALVMLRDQHFPFRLRPLVAAHDMFAAVTHCHPAPSPAEGVGTPIDRVGQESEDRAVDW